MAYDTRDGYTVLYGGTWDTIISGKSASGFYYDTWTFEHGIWTELSVSGPPESTGGGMAYDPVDGYLVLFGGYGKCTVCNQTWTFSAGDWTDLNIPGPPPELSGSLAWDPALGELILYGGSSTSTPTTYSSTWAFAHGSWTNLTIAGPPAREGAALAYVPAVGGLILFGGAGLSDSGTLNLSDTWLFDGEWKNLALDGPPGRYFTQMAFEPSAGNGILFGGLAVVKEPNQVNLGDTWSFDGSSWQELVISGPSPRFFAQLSYDAADGYVLLFGGAVCSTDCDSETGLNDTWTFTMGRVAPVASVSINPTAICVLNDHSCAAGTWQAEVNVSVHVSYVNTPPEAATIANPSLTILPWGQIELDASRPVVSCQTPAAATVSCTLNATTLTAGNTTGFRVDWTSGQLLNTLYAGDNWTVAFGITSTGPPYGSVPVYACTTATCVALGSDEVDGTFSCVGFQPAESVPVENESLPYANVTVDPPRITPGGSSPPSQNIPPPPPGAPIAFPGPITIPSPVTIPSPIVTAVIIGTPAVSLSAAAAGVVGAGFTRAALQRRAVAQGQPVGNVVRPTRSAFDEDRPTDLRVGRFD